MPCQYDQLCARLKALIDGLVHSVQALWDENLTTENWVFLLVDAKNAFNDINRVRMMWIFRHLWLSGARFVFNFYRHWSSLVLWNGDGTASFIHSKEGVTHRDPLAMIVYGIGILPLINNLKREIPDVTQPCYADNSGALGTFVILETCFDLLTCQGLVQGYYTKPSKSVPIVHLENLEAGKLFGACHGFKMFTGARYLGVYIRDDESKRDWLR